MLEYYLAIKVSINYLRSLFSNFFVNIYAVEICQSSVLLFFDLPIIAEFSTVFSIHLIQVSEKEMINTINMAPSSVNAPAVYSSSYFLWRTLQNVDLCSS